MSGCHVEIISYAEPCIERSSTTRDTTNLVEIQPGKASLPADVLNTFDYAIIRFLWDVTGGTDLDTRVGILTSIPYQFTYTGWCQSDFVPNISGLPESDYYLIWGGDNVTSAGGESVLVNFDKIVADNPGIPEIELDLRAFWYDIRNSGDFTLQFETYLGGTMQVSGLDFVNVGGVVVQTTNVVVNTPQNISSCVIGTCVKHLRYNTATRVALIEDCN